MSRSVVIMFACHSCKMSFRKDLSIFGDKDELCPHCAARFIGDAVTPELMFFHEANDEMDRMLALANERDRPLNSASEMDALTTLALEEKEFAAANKDPEADVSKDKYEKRRSKLLAKKRNASLRK